VPSHSAPGRFRPTRFPVPAMKTPRPAHFPQVSRTAFCKTPAASAKRRRARRNARGFWTGELRAQASASPTRLSFARRWFPRPVGRRLPSRHKTSAARRRCPLSRVCAHAINFLRLVQLQPRQNPRPASAKHPFGPAPAATPSTPAEISYPLPRHQARAPSRRPSLSSGDIPPIATDPSRSRPAPAPRFPSPAWKRPVRKHPPQHRFQIIRR